MSAKSKNPLSYLTRNFERSITAKDRESLGKINRETLDILRRPGVDQDDVLNQMISRSLKVIDISSTSEKKIVSTALGVQWDTLLNIPDNSTKELSSLKRKFLDNDFKEGIKDFTQSMEDDYIDAQNLAFLKTTPSFTDTISDTLPKSLTRAVKDIHFSTAHKLFHEDDIVFISDTGEFINPDAPEDTASVSEANIIYSSLEILRELTASELLSFLNHISEYPPMAVDHPVGRKIKSVVDSWDELIDFDRDHYYHARAFEGKACPYTEKQMTKAPNGITWHGRYNHIGESHYYFSDKVKGAVIEVRKHCERKMSVQVAKIRPKRSITMLDLSVDYPRQNKFLEYCRFSPDTGDYAKVKREYLIPCFVASCCKLREIDGIKYHGSREYKNYVTWSDDHFKFDSFLIDEDESQ